MARQFYFHSDANSPQPTSRAPESRDSEIPLKLDLQIHNATILSLLKSYADYLIKAKHYTDKKANEEIAKIVSTALDRGHIDNATANSLIENAISTEAYVPLSVRQSRYRKNYIERTIVDELIPHCNLIGADFIDELTEAMEAQRKENEKIKSLINKAGSYVVDHTNWFMTTYGPMFDPEFVKTLGDFE